jgi:hypothetical protein
MVSTILTLVVIPLGCIKASDSLIEVAAAGMPDGERIPVMDQSPRNGGNGDAASPASMPLLLMVWGKLIAVLLFVFYAIRGIWLLLSQFLPKKKTEADHTEVNMTDASSSPPSATGNTGGAAPAAQGGPGGSVSEPGDGGGKQAKDAAPIDKAEVKKATASRKKVSKKKSTAKKKVASNKKAVTKKAVVKKAPVKKAEAAEPKVVVDSISSEVINPEKRSTGKKLQASSKKPETQESKPDKQEGFGTAVRKKPSGGRRGIKLKTMVDQNDRHH